MRWRAYHKETGAIWKPNKMAWRDSIFMAPNGKLFCSTIGDPYFPPVVKKLDDYEAIPDTKATIVVRHKKGYVTTCKRSSFDVLIHDKLFYLRVKIVRCSVEGIWYADRVGEIVTVVNASSAKGFYTFCDEAGVFNQVIRKSDCEVVESDCNINA